MARQTVLDVFGRIYPNATPEMIDYKFRLAQVRCGYHYPSIWYHLLAAEKKKHLLPRALTVVASLLLSYTDGWSAFRFNGGRG